jgi:hypothetical protein
VGDGHALGGEGSFDLAGDELSGLVPREPADLGELGLVGRAFLVLHSAIRPIIRDDG